MQNTAGTGRPASRHRAGEMPVGDPETAAESEIGHQLCHPSRELHFTTEIPGWTAYRYRQPSRIDDLERWREFTECRDHAIEYRRIEIDSPQRQTPPRSVQNR